MQSSSRQRLALLFSPLAVTLALSTPLTAIAQSDSGIAANGTGVARISLIAGTVGVQRGDSSESLTAALNAPILGGDYMTTGDQSTAEVEFDGRSQLRLGQGAQLRFTQLDTGNRVVQLAQGTLELRLLQDADGTSEIDTPSVAIKPDVHGAYRVTVTPDGQTLVTVRSGRADVETPQGAQTLSPGTTLVAAGAAADPSLQTVAAVAPDDFDRFNAERDRRHESALADAAFVNSDIGGIDDLSGNGRWVNDGSYGRVWSPAAVGSDWAPYRDGRWVWEDGYGWTWLGAEPWGWAPYHYGSWYHSPDYGWCWYPPRPRIDVPWRPALVAFIGFGAGAGLSLGFDGGPAFGNIGWVPLAPYEPYHPWWGNRYGYNGNTTIVNNVTNVTNVTNINVYRNVQNNGVSSVTSQRFLQGNFTHNTPIAPTQLRQARVFGGAVPVVPTASNLRFTSAPETSPVAVRPALMQRAFAGNSEPVRRTSFVQQRVALANVTHAPVTPLHFQDARSTPLEPQHRAAGIAEPLVPQARPVNPAYATPAKVAPSYATPAKVAPSYATPAKAVSPAYAAPTKQSSATTHAPVAGDPWARFNDSRGIEPQHRRAPGIAAPGASDTGTTHASATDGRVATPATPAHAPAVRSYHEPAPSTVFEQTTSGKPYPAAVTRDPAVRTPAAQRAPQERETRPTYHDSSGGQTYHNPSPNQAVRTPRMTPAEPRTNSSDGSGRPEHARTERSSSDAQHQSDDPHAGRPPRAERHR